MSNSTVITLVYRNPRRPQAAPLAMVPAAAPDHRHVDHFLYLFDWAGLPKPKVNERYRIRIEAIRDE